MSQMKRGYKGSFLNQGAILLLISTKHNTKRELGHDHAGKLAFYAKLDIIEKGSVMFQGDARAKKLKGSSFSGRNNGKGNCGAQRDHFPLACDLIDQP